MIGSRSPMSLAIFSISASGAMPPAMSRTGSPGTTRNNVKISSDTRPMMTTPCVRRRIRKFNVNIREPHRVARAAPRIEVRLGSSQAALFDASIEPSG